MFKRHKSALLIITILCAVIALYSFNIYLILNLHESNLNSIRSISSEISSIKAKDGIDGANGSDGYTPIEGIDYHSGVNGKDSVSTHTTETIVKEVPVNGKDGQTPIIKCNKEKNRWEVKYGVAENWKILNGEKIPCTIISTEKE